MGASESGTGWVSLDYGEGGLGKAGVRRGHSEGGRDNVGERERGRGRYGGTDGWGEGKRDGWIYSGGARDTA